MSEVTEARIREIVREELYEATRKSQGELSVLLGLERVKSGVEASDSVSDCAERSHERQEKVSGSLLGQVPNGVVEVVGDFAHKQTLSGGDADG